MELEEIQKKFTEGILTQSFEKELVDLITPGGELSSLKCLTVYRMDYISRMTESMQNSYEGVWSVLGDASFEKVAVEYLKNYQSESFDVSLIGQYFPQFLKDHALICEYPFLFDLADFEQKFNRLFHLAFIPGLDRNDFAHMKHVEKCRLTLSEAHFVLDSPFNIFAIWGQREEKNPHYEGVNFRERELRMFYQSSEGIKSFILSLAQNEILKNLKAGDSLEKAMEKCLAEGHIPQESEVADFFSFLTLEQLVKKSELC